MLKNDAGFSQIEAALNDLSATHPNALTLDYAQPLFDHYEERCRELGVELNRDINERFNPRMGAEYRGGSRPAVMDLGDVVIVRPWEKDLHSDEQLEEFSVSVERALRQNQHVILDFSGLRSTNSTVVGKLVAWHRDFGQAELSFALCAVPIRLEKIFNINGLSKVLCIADDHAQALEKIDRLHPKAERQEPAA